MKGKLLHHLKKKIPCRKIVRGVDAVEDTIKWTSPQSQYIKSWCAYKAGLWQDEYFCDFHQMLAADLELRSFILAIHYKRLKYGWSPIELEELAGSRNYERYLGDSSFCALIASLYYEIGDFEKTLEFLHHFLSDDPTQINGFLGLTSFALKYGYSLSGLPADSCAKLQSLSLKLHDFNTFFSNSLHDRLIAVVGNANQGKGSGDGVFIDACDQVFRFNNFPSEERYEKDYGKKTTVWVRTPSIHEVPQRIDIQPATILISSPFLLHTKNGNWQWLVEYCDREENLVLFDAPVYRGLVQQLSAPPSAGLLTAYNLCNVSNDLSKILFLGFDFNTGEKSHYFDNQKPADRHNWAEEKRVFSRINPEPKSSV